MDEKPKEIKNDEKISFQSIVELIPEYILKDNIIEQLTFKACNQIIIPIQCIDKNNYTSVYYDGTTICYNITIPKGYINYIQNLYNNEKIKYVKQLNYNFLNFI